MTTESNTRSGPAALQLTNVSKTFPGTRALSDVSFRVAAGEVATLIGHNGSGKSTLIKVMSGFHRPDDHTETGETPAYVVAGDAVRFGDPTAVQRAGIRFIHQDLGLIDGLTVLENLRLGRGLYDATGLWRIHWRREHRLAREQLDRLNLRHISPKALVGDLSVLAKTEVAIARAVSDKEPPRVLVLDEPTAALPDAEVSRLFSLVRTLAGQGTAIVYVSHRLEEILDIGDTVTVLREGRVVATAAATEHDVPALASLVAGGSVERAKRLAPRTDREVTLRFEDVHSRELRGADFEIYAGEIVGVAGLAGSGVHGIPDVLLGISELESGLISMGGTRLEKLGAESIRRSGLVALPASKPLKAIQTMTLRENLTLADLSPFWQRGIFSTRAERGYSRAVLREANVRPAEPEAVMSTLSGGNQQKVVLAKWLRTNPTVLVLDEPVQGVDIAGRLELMAQLIAASKRGISVVLCSSDFDDLAEVCSRVLIMSHGRTNKALIGEEVTRNAIVDLSYA